MAIQPQEIHDLASEFCSIQLTLDHPPFRLNISGRNTYELSNGTSSFHNYTRI